MNDFLKLFIQEMTATIEGLMGSSPHIEKKAEAVPGALNITPPYALINIESNGDFDASISLAIPVNMATALADMMIGNEGSSKEEMNDDDLDAIKEIASNIFGAIATNLGSQKKMPKLNFSCKNIELKLANDGVDSFSFAYEFDFSLHTIAANFHLLITQEFEDGFKNPTTKQANEAIPQTQAQTSQNLSNEEMKNIGMLLDIRLNVKVKIGQKKMLLKDVVSMDIGSVIELNQLANDPLEILIDDKVIAKGEVVIVDGNFGIQVTEIGTKRQRLEQLKGI